MKKGVENRCDKDIYEERIKGNYTGLSELDVKKIDTLYNCTGYPQLFANDLTEDEIKEKKKKEKEKKKGKDSIEIQKIGQNSSEENSIEVQKIGQNSDEALAPEKVTIPIGNATK